MIKIKTVTVFTKKENPKIGDKVYEFDNGTLITHTIENIDNGMAIIGGNDYWIETDHLINQYENTLFFTIEKAKRRYNVMEIKRNLYKLSNDCIETIIKLIEQNKNVNPK